MTAGASVCESCGARIGAAELLDELRSISYLLSELSDWEAQGLVANAQARELRHRYEQRLEELRSQLDSITAHSEKPAPPFTEASQLAASETAEAVRAAEAEETTGTTPASNPARAAASSPARSSAPHSSARRPGAAATGRVRRPLFETLADPHTLRLLLYMGAAMLVVGIVIWLRDLLYLKLQEPLVQAALLAFGTVAVTVAGWLTILRTRLRMTGRALTLTGSLLAPVNFWFLVRSGLISNNGRAWVVCALCAALYAHTAALLREKLYVYLACSAGVATAWALVLRAAPDAYGLYALTLMMASLIFLHLSRLFPLSTVMDSYPSGQSEGRSVQAKGAAGKVEGAESEASAPQWSRWSYELWGPPLARAALVGAALSAPIYMLLRLGPSRALLDGAFRWRSSDYDAGLAMVLFIAGAYVSWFTGQHIYTDRRAALYTAAALALFWTEFLLLDGLRVSARVELLAVSLMTMAAALAARFLSDEETARALYRSAVVVCVALVLSIPAALFATTAFEMSESAALVCLGLSLGALSAPRFCRGIRQLILTHGAVLFVSLAVFVALVSMKLKEETVFALSALWPFALYGGARLIEPRRIEAQLVAPLVRVADAEFALLLLLSSIVALTLHLVSDASRTDWRLSILFALLVTTLYGAVRAWRGRSQYGAIVSAMAALVMVPSSLDTLQVTALFPSSWPIAAGVIIVAFALQHLGQRLLRPAREGHARRTKEGGLVVQSGPVIEAVSPSALVRLVADVAVLASALLWFTRAFDDFYGLRWSGAVVLLLSALYWILRASRERRETFVYLSNLHAGLFLMTALLALRFERRWTAMAFTLILFPSFYLLGHLGRGLKDEWMGRPLRRSAAILSGLVFVEVWRQAAPSLQTGNESLLAPAVTGGALCAMMLAATLFSRGRERMRYFRSSLGAAVTAFALWLMRAGFDLFDDVEMYTTPVAVVLLIVAYLLVRGESKEQETDASLLLWTGSLLLCGPLLIRSLQFRLLLDLPAPGRDLFALCAALLLLLFGVLGQLRAPVIMGTISLVLELFVLALTSVEWLQVPLKVYLITAGVLSILVWGMFEYGRERLLSMRQRLHERGAQARQRFEEWR